MLLIQITKKLSGDEHLRFLIIFLVNALLIIGELHSAVLYANADYFPAIVELSRPAVVTLYTKGGSGSGFFIGPDGYLLTNKHVVGQSKQVQVMLSDKAEMTGEVIAVGEEDVALVRVDKRNLPTLRLGSVSGVRVGEIVLIIGSPLGLTDSTTKGTVSHMERKIENETFIQIDGWINPGNSGGPVINMKGEVVGIVTKTTKEANGIGFALPIEVAYKLLLDNRVPVETSLSSQGLALKPKEPEETKNSQKSTRNENYPNSEQGNNFVITFVTAMICGIGGWFSCRRYLRWEIQREKEIEIIFKK